MANDIGRHVQADVSNPLTLEDSHEHLNGLGLHWGWVRQQLIWFGVKFRLFTKLIAAVCGVLALYGDGNGFRNGSRCYVDGL